MPTGRWRIGRHAVAAVTAVVLLSVTLCANARSGSQDDPCQSQGAGQIPARPHDALTGSQFAKQIEQLNGEPRELLIEALASAGDIPDFLRHLIPIRLQLIGPAGPKQLVFCAAPDYLAIGSDDDYLLTPMRLETALRIATRFGFLLPTPKMVDAIYEQADRQLVPQPLPASDQMRSTAYYLHHNALIEAQRETSGVSPGDLVAGHKKDLVLTNRLWANPDRVAIYGWHEGQGSPIQPLSTVHGWRYADYSHGIRLISSRIFVDGRPGSLLEALGDPRLSRALTSEGPLRNAADLIASLESLGVGTLLP